MIQKNIFALFVLMITINAQVTGLAGWDLFVDPGHSQTGNMGVNGYSEAEEVLRTALHLREILLTQTDIDTVWSSRYNDQVNVSLLERTDDANTRGASWYHSIHSNAGAPANNNVLLLWGMWIDGTPDPPVGGEDMSNIMVELLSDVMRLPSIGSRGDCGFYTWSDYCQNNPTIPYLYVNRNTIMPSELSEQGHHTNPLQNQLDMNDEYTRMLAYSMFWTILDKFGIDRPFPGILSGIISDSETGIRVNGATVSVDGESYTTDTYASLFHQYSSDPDELHNGFYFFEGLPDTPHEMIISAPGYYADTLQVNALSSNFVTFRDITLIPSTPPHVTASYPVDGDSTFAAWDLLWIEFSRVMNEASVAAAFTISPDMEGGIVFSADHRRMTFVPNDTLEFLTDYTLTISGSAADTYGHPFDGNQDGTGGDDLIIEFKTSPPDITPPTIISTYPIADAQLVDLRPIISIVWDEELEPESISNDLVKLERLYNLQLQPTILEHHVMNNQSVLVLYTENDLLDSEAYRVRIFPGFEDLFGNVQSGGTAVRFTTSNFDYIATNIDDFENNALVSWWEIQESGSNRGIVTLECSRDISTDVTVLSEGSGTSLRLSYGWDPSASLWLIREYLAPGSPPRSIRFAANRIMQAYVFGDGNGNKFRFCIDDDIYGSRGTEVSPWFDINWYGWRLVSWDMTHDGIGSWIGDGSLDGTLEFDSIQLSYTPGQPTSGTYFIDNLRVVTHDYLSLDEQTGIKPTELALLPNYPNPFNPMTNIPFTLPESAEVQIKIYNLKGEEVAHVFNGHLEQGYHVTRWNASSVSSGIYLVELRASGVSRSSKVMVLK